MRLLFIIPLFFSVSDTDSIVIQQQEMQVDSTYNRFDRFKDKLKQLEEKLKKDDGKQS